MRVALVSTCAVAVPPRDYGGTELVVAELAKMLTRRGHHVTVYATGDSEPGTELRYRFAAPIWPPNDASELRHAAFAWREIARGGFDVVHVHQAPSIALGALVPGLPLVATLHHCRDPALIDFYLDFPETTFVAISRRQAELVPELAVRHVVHHGLDPCHYPAGDGEGGYCAFLGRLAPEKAPHVAIDAALAAGVPLRIGGAPHACHARYFDAEIAPRLARAGAAVAWLGSVALPSKVALLAGARALLFPIDWEEPFGLVMIESMLVGTPVLAFARGSVAEIVEEGVTGFIVKDAREMAARLRTLGGFDRARCRARAVERWSSARMAHDYERVYEQAAREKRAARGVEVSGTRARARDREEPWAGQR
jgi:glycosyltransferase involved in cell wall biosynthesis